MMESDADRLAQAIAERCFGGRLPHCPSEICSAVVQCIPCVRDADEESTQMFVSLLLLALVERLIAQTHSDKVEFQN
jgi:hypothetical protein